jgi:Protein of unknown function (DUF2752)
MSASSGLTSPLSAHSRRTAAATIVLAASGNRALAMTLLGVAVPWLAYTRLYFFLHPRHLTFDGGLWMWIFNKPDPTCGLTRTFAWMWRGDLGHAVAVYPLGPLVFLATFVLASYGLAVLVTGRALQLHIPVVIAHRLVLVGLVLVGLNWIAKLAWLGM